MLRRGTRSILAAAALAATALLLAGSTASEAQRRSAVPIILDTDIGPDVDDAGTVALLHGLAKRGEAKILGMLCCTSNPYGAPCLDALNTYYGRPDIAIGTLKGRPGFLVESKYAEPVAKRFPNDLQHGDRAPDATKVYRQILSRQPDRSVVVCAVGPLSNLPRLLDSGPDEHSPLDGRALVARKVRLLSVMGGRFPEGKEWNFEQDPPAAQRVAADWPTPIRFSGWEIGSRVFTGKTLQETVPSDHPVKAAYELYVGPGKARESWDQTALLAAVRGAEPLWMLRKEGSTVVDPKTGANHWVRDDRDHEYLVEKRPVEIVAEEIETLMRLPK
ncbi:MAG: nucleoside hydrolase [Armatimonadota bacterium]